MIDEGGEGGRRGAAGRPCLAPGGYITTGVSAWFLCLVTHRTRTTGPLVEARVPSAACCRACLKCDLCVSALREQRRSVRAPRRSAARRKTPHGQKDGRELKDSILLNRIQQERRMLWGCWGGGCWMGTLRDDCLLMVEACVPRRGWGAQMEPL